MNSGMKNRDVRPAEHSGALKSDLGGRHPPLRPRDAATLILIDRQREEPAVLMGRRHRAHAFMPDTYVFPGGSRDRDDGHVRVADELNPAVMTKLRMGKAKPVTEHRARALAITAVRETHEEVGIFVAASGRSSRRPQWSAFEERGLAPSLSALRYIARAITPPGQKRRFDTRFFACFRDEIAETEAAESNELLDLRWVPLSDTGNLAVPRITQAVLQDLRFELTNDPMLPHGRPVPFYHVRHRRFARDIL